MQGTLRDFTEVVLIDDAGIEVLSHVRMRAQQAPLSV
jgi:hypothetical protein